MNNEVCWTFEGMIKPGKLEDLYELLEEFVQVTKKEEKVLKYEFWINADKTTVFVHERFVDCDGAIAHVHNAGFLLPRLAECMEIQPFHILGNMSPEGKEMFGAMGAGFTEYVNGL